MRASLNVPLCCPPRLLPLPLRMKSMEKGVGCLGGMAYTCGCHRLPAFRNSGESAGGEDERGECEFNSAKEDPLDVTTVVFFVVNTVPSVVVVAAVEEVFSITEEAISVIPRT